MGNSASVAPVGGPDIDTVIDRVDEILEATYWTGDHSNVSDVLAETVYILLSRQTHGTVYQRVYSDLRKRFPTWGRMLRARSSTLERVIRPVGRSQQRVAQLRALLREVDRTNREFHVGPYDKDGGDLTLEFLRTWNSKATEAYLEKLPGIGPKSARYVLAYAFGEDRFAVDTHAGRILRRLGVGDNKLGQPSHAAFEAAIPKAARARLLANLFHHGRTVCRESAPQCGSCPLISFCVTGRSKVAPTAGHDSVIDLFGGAGAMGLGFKQAGFRIAAVVEIERHAAQTYRLNHPGVPVFETSVEDVTAGELRSWLPGLDAPAVVMAGPPCQGYSVAGARTKGDRRNLLFRHVSRLARELGARSVLIENVPGVRRVNGVTYTKRITASLRRAGFASWKQPAILCASDFGVSQNRRRLFFVGVDQGVGLPDVPVPTHIPPGVAKRDRTLAHTVRLIERLRDLPNLGPGEGSERLQLPDGRVVLNSTAMNHSTEVVAKIKVIPRGGGPISYRRLDVDIARTLVAGHRALPVHPTQHRSITVREAARIQGFPDSYFFCGPRASQPLQVANAVPPALAQAVARELRKSLEASEALSSEVSQSAVA